MIRPCQGRWLEGYVDQLITRDALGIESGRRPYAPEICADRLPEQLTSQARKARAKERRPAPSAKRSSAKSKGEDAAEQA